MNKNGLLMSGAVALILAVTTSAQAVNPANWSFFVETTGSDAYWNSPTSVDTGGTQYDYNWTINSLELRFGILGWFDSTSLLTTASGSGSHVGGLPVVITDQNLSNGGNAAHVLIEVDSGGTAHASVTGVTFASPIDGARINGDISVSATIIPEPASVALIGFGGVALLLRRRRR
jgi:hypothetical protein